LLLGVTGAWIGGRWLESLLFGVGTRDPVAFAGAVATLLAVGVLAAWLPAMRATRVDTMRTLTAE
jgi:ABC-type antimicrobial peptide transport system permease subunit